MALVAATLKTNWDRLYGKSFKRWVDSKRRKNGCLLFVKWLKLIFWIDSSLSGYLAFVLIYFRIQTINRNFRGILMSFMYSHILVQLWILLKVEQIATLLRLFFLYDQSGDARICVIRRPPQRREERERSGERWRPQPNERVPNFLGTLGKNQR